MSYIVMKLTVNGSKSILLFSYRNLIYINYFLALNGGKTMHGASAEWKRFLIVILLFAFLFYACKKKIEITPQISEYSAKIAEADELFKRGSYACLQEARAIYEELLSFEEYKKQTRETPWNPNDT